MPLVGENSRGWPVPQHTDLHQSVNEGYTLVRQSHYHAHRLAIWLLQLCGLRCLTDKSQVGSARKYHSMLRGVPELQRCLAEICFEFQLSMEPVNKRLQARTENPMQYRPFLQWSTRHYAIYIGLK